MILLISDCLDFYFKHWCDKNWNKLTDKQKRMWPTHALITKAQYQIWPSEDTLIKEQIAIEDFDREENKKDVHYICLKLLDYNAIPVGDRKWQTARATTYPDNVERKYFHDEVILRFCVFVHLDLFHALYLVIKNQYEQYIKKVFSIKSFTGYNFLKSLSDPKFADDFQVGFDKIVNPDNREIVSIKKFTCSISELHELFLKYNFFKKNYEEISGLDFFTAIVNEYINHKIFLVGLDSDELESFINDPQSIIIKLTKATALKVKEYLEVKTRIDVLEVKLGEALLELEAIKREMAVVKNTWLFYFGEIDLKIKSVTLIYNRLERKIDLKRKNPKITIPEINKIIEQEKPGTGDKEADRKLLQYIKSLKLTVAQEAGKPDEDEFFQAYEFTRKFLVENYKMYNPKTMYRFLSKCAHNDKIASLGWDINDVRMRQLRELWEESQQVYAREKYISKQDLFLEQLKLKLRAKALYTQWGLPLPKETSAVSTGATLNETIEIMKGEEKYLEEGIIELEPGLYPQFTNEEYCKQKAEIESEEIINETKALMQNQLDKKIKEGSELVKESKNLDIFEDIDVIEYTVN